MKTHYETLGVPKTADQKEIRSVYRALVKIHHPDAAGSGHEPGRFGEITAAYTVLVNPERRRQYDQTLAGQAGGSRPGIFRFREFKNWLLSHSFFRVFFSAKRVSRPSGSHSPDRPHQDLPIPELIQRIIYSRNIYVQTNAVRAVFARGGSSEVKDMLRLLHSGVDDSVKEEILNGLKTNREPVVQNAIRDVYDMEKSLKIKKLIRHYLQQDQS